MSLRQDLKVQERDLAHFCADGKIHQFSEFELTFSAGLQLVNQFQGVGWIQYINDVTQRRVNDFIIIRKTVKFLGCKIDKNSMLLITDTVSVGMGVVSPSLKIFTTDQTGIDIDS